MVDVFTSPLQGTVRELIAFEGVGTHQGRHARMKIQPAPEGSGLVFVRADVTDRENRIPVHHKWVERSALCTTLRNAEGVCVQTVEHLLAALFLYGIDNAVIELTSEEVPILDGSARPYVQALQKAGRLVQKAQRRFLRICKPIEVQEGNRKEALFPASSGFSVSVACDYSAHQVPPESYESALTTQSFFRDIAPARSFGFFEEVTALRAQGLAKGSSLENAVVFSEGKPLNPGGLRFKNEIVRHKVLDVLGDLALLGAPLVAHFSGNRPGHALSAQLVSELMARPESWEFTYPLQGTPASVSPLSFLPVGEASQHCASA